jgi:hypothetical protein
MTPKPDKLIPALYGGVIMALISSIPFLNFLNCLCCAGIMAGGFFAVFFYKNNFTPDTPPYTSGDCLALGALAGVFGALIGTVLSAIFMAIMGDVLRDFVLRFLERSDLDLPQEFWDQMDQLMSAEFSIFTLFTELLTNMLIYPLFGLLGGLIGYNIYKPKVNLMPPPFIPPAPPAV